MHYGAFDVPHSHKLTTPLLQGSVVDLEYFQPHAPEIGGRPTLRIINGTDGEMQAQKRRRRLLQDTGRRTPGSQFDTTIMQQTSDATAPCTQSIECDPAWEDVAQGVVSVYAINTRIKALGLCTGSIVNAALGRIYLLTADHCFTDKNEISDFEYWLLIFNYQSPCNNDTAPPFTQGVKLLFYNSAADVLLLDMPSTIPDRFKPFYMGFDAQDDAVPTTAVGIHHPHGNIKRISYVNNSISTQFTPTRFPPGEVQPTTRTHFEVIWTQGSTQGGSSGSPLIDAKTRRIVGVLTGGLSTCDTRSSPDYFGRLAKAWDNGLKRFLSNQPEENAQNKADLQILDNSYRAQNQTIVYNFLDGDRKPRGAPIVNFFPIVQTFYNDTCNANVTVYLTAPPTDGGVMTVDFAINSLPGNPVNVTDYIHIQPNRITFTSQNYSSEGTINVDTTRLNGTAGGRLLRYDLEATMVSSANADFVQLSVMKGIVEEKRVKWSEYAPIMVNKLPFYIKAEVGAPITSPSGKALFQWRAEEDGSVDFYICALSFGQNAIGQRQRIGATVSVYLNGTFVWTLSHDPLALDPSCIHIVDAQVFAYSTYHVVASDDNDFNAVLPAWGIREAYVGPANTLAQAIRGSSFRAPLQGLNALAPSAAANFSSRLVAAAAAGTPSNDGATPVSVSLGPSSAPGGYTISATKQNTTSIQGPQLTDQYNNFPDTPAAPGADGQQVGTRAETTGSSDGAPVPAVPQQRTRIFGSVLNKLTVKSPEEAAAAAAPPSGQVATKSISIPIINILPSGVGRR
ncbi:trypsin-like serine protease [Coccomyxa subellipsoidea C-169]|uniref:Trypsin-like serine protease n=1 Tax=Coccomyxa subellipsoidea (strain C-169) TaxID=574566 RepID=I0YQ09_COCSC|nr:trypsin-like serine protease [Coccomyxa subellipsoidea C-169]EIE20478.1 trypsin-like serine protease [Coccomyxa subellipsoidea C-169]|eukprot:XP_005645022.1 trypsin-like serine protease [Coccomyxa subellipsoidea C-169]